MSSVTGTLRRLVLRIPESATRVRRRGFHCDDDGVRERIESIGTTFVAGYHLAIEAVDTGVLAARLADVPVEARGWAYEGAALGLAVRDGLAPWRPSMLARFLEGPGDAHAYMVHVGAGWALGRFRRRTWSTLTRVDPLLAWLAIDGYGFRGGYFKWSRYGGGGAAPAWLTGMGRTGMGRTAMGRTAMGRRVFDQGLGRSLWFVGGAGVERIAAAIDSFAIARRPDLWSGVGLACAYAGGVGPDSVRSLAERADANLPCVAQGAAFAAKARLRAGNPADHTRSAVEILCGTTPERAAAITDEVRAGLDPRGAADGAAYEQWRTGVRAALAGFRAAAPSVRNPRTTPRRALAHPDREVTA